MVKRSCPPWIIRGGDGNGVGIAPCSARAAMAQGLLNQMRIFGSVDLPACQRGGNSQLLRHVAQGIAVAVNCRPG